jgi:small subunit ribosomal protein S20
MANHKSAFKRIRANEKKRVLNRYYLKTTRTFMKKLEATTNKPEAEALYKKVSSMLDKLAKKKKSKLARHLHQLA